VRSSRRTTVRRPAAPSVGQALRRGPEEFQAFGEKLMPLIQQAGLEPDEPIIVPAHNFVNQ
jgi:hypothetical protein